MTNRKPLISEENSAIVDGFEPIDVEERKMLAKIPPGKRWLVLCRKSEEIRTDLRNKFMEDFPELSFQVKYGKRKYKSK
jgi:hypothetical protein